MSRPQRELPLNPRYPAGTPRANMGRGSPEWCYATMDYARSLFLSYQTEQEEWEKILAQIKEERVYERIPEDKPYGSLNKLLKAEIGVTERQSRQKFAALAAKATTEEVAKKVKRGGDRRSEKAQSNGKLPVGRQSDRAATNAIGERNQRKLDRIARERSDLRAQIIAGELSIDGAYIEAGWQEEKIQISKDPAKAAKSLKRHFKGDRLTALIEALTKDD